MGRSGVWTIILLMTAATLLHFTGPGYADDPPTSGGHIRVKGDSELLSSSYYISGSGLENDPLILSGFPEDSSLEIMNISYWIEVRDQVVDVDTENTALTIDNVTGCYLENVSLKNTASLLDTDILENLSINGSAFNFAYSSVATTNAMDVGAEGNITLWNSSISSGYPAGTSDDLCNFGSRNFEVKWSRFDNVQIIYLGKGDSINVRESSFFNESILWPKVYMTHSRNIILNSTFDNSRINVMDSWDLLIMNNSFKNRTSGIIFGLYHGLRPDTGRYNILTGNHFEACGGLTVRGGGFSTKTIIHWLIHDNYFGNCSSPAIEWDYRIQNLDDIFIWRNIFYHNRGTGDVNGSLPQISMVPGISMPEKAYVNLSRNGVGNYWRDHTTPDADGDGIVDTEYRIYTTSYPEFWNNYTDLYPVSNPFFDLTKPHLKVLEPMEKVTDKEYTRIRWEAWDTDSGLESVLLSRDMGNWTDVTNETWWPVILSPGVNRLYLKAYDKAGLFNLTTVEIELMSISGPIRLLSPRDSSIIESSEVTITWSVDEDFPLAHQELEVDDGQMEISTGDRGKDVTLEDGTHEIRLICWDPKGTRIEKQARFIVDTVPPIIHINAPFEEAVISNQLVRFHWKVSDVNGIASVRYRVDSELWIDPGIRKDYSLSALQDYGDHTLEVEAYDIAGRKTVETVGYSVGEGTLRITKPGNGYATNHDHVTIEWTIDERFHASSVILEEIEGGNTYDVTGLYELSVPLTSPGSYRIGVTATDEYGNQASDLIVVYGDMEPPSIRIFNDKYYVNDDPLLVQWSGFDTHGVGGYGYRMDGSDWIDLEIRTTLELRGLSEGEHEFEIICTDMAGNTAIDVYSFLFDITPPEVSFTPDDDMRFNLEPIMTLMWACNDDNGIGNVSLRVGKNRYEYEGTSNLWEGVLQEGPIVATITAYDSAGNLASDTISIMTDTVDPVIEWIEPSYTRSNVETVIFKWRVMDELGISNITLEENHIPVWTGTVGGDLEINLTPADGAHYYTLTATDLAGRSTTVSRVMIIDRSPPVIDNLTYMLEDGDLTVEWKVHDDLTGVTEVFLEVGALSYESSETTGTWVAGGLDPGINIIHIQVVDGTGNTAERTLEVRVVAKEEPADGKGVIFWILIALAGLMITGGGVFAFILLNRSYRDGNDDKEPDPASYGVGTSIPGQGTGINPGFGSVAPPMEWKGGNGKTR
ncbi:MAG: hypothetical protein ACMUHB_01330 [Thermoplasmatota archaeon]